MGFGYGRNAYDVQRDNGKRFDFAKIKAHYESVKPINSKKRKHLDVRPVGERDRSHERMVKVNDNEYYITCNAYRYYDIHSDAYTHSRAVTFSLHGDTEVITVHTPRQAYDKEKLATHYLSSPQTYYFYHFNLPVGLSMVNNKSCKYVRLDTGDGFKYFTLEKGDITFTRKSNMSYWSPLVVHRESVRNLDRQKTKEWRKLTKPLIEYLNIMMDMAEPKHIAHYQNPFMALNTPSIMDVFKQTEDGNPSPHWFTLAEYYKHRCTEVHWGRKLEGGYNRLEILSKEKLSGKLHKDLYKLVKPFAVTEVPLGEMCKDPYKSWK